MWTHQEMAEEKNKKFNIEEVYFDKYEYQTVKTSLSKKGKLLK